MTQNGVRTEFRERYTVGLWLLAMTMPMHAAAPRPRRQRATKYASTRDEPIDSMGASSRPGKCSI